MGEHAGHTAESWRRALHGVQVGWETIQRVLSDWDGSLSEAARCLGVHHRSLRWKAGRKGPAKEDHSALRQSDAAKDVSVCSQWANTGKG